MNENPRAARAAIRRRRVLIGLTLGYSAMVALATMGPPWVVTSALDLAERVAWALGSGDGLSRASLEFLANVAMFVPLGALFALLAGAKRWWVALLAVLALTCSIELLQAGMPARVSDLRDVAANTAGGVLGMLLALLASIPRRRIALASTAGALAFGAVLLATTGAMSVPPLARADTGRIDAQLDYVQKYWNSRNADAYGALETSDCVNFASQSLIARGWEQTDEWWHTKAPGARHSYSDAWISSTALRGYLAAHAELATAVDASAPDRVTTGDLVQFDWDSDGKPDHTGVVVSVADEGSGRVIRYASHSNDRERQGVDEAIERDGRGGSYSFWHLLV